MARRRLGGVGCVSRVSPVFRTGLLVLNPIRGLVAGVSPVCLPCFARDYCGESHLGFGGIILIIYKTKNDSIY